MLFASRLSISSVGNIFLGKNNNRKVFEIVYKNFNTQPKENVFRRSLRSRVFEAKSTANATGGLITDTPLRIGQALLAGGSVLGIGALSYYGLGFSNGSGFIDRYGVWPQYIKERLHSTYAYFGSSLGLTALSALTISKSPALMRIVGSNSMLFMFASIAAMIGSGMLVRSLPYNQGQIDAKKFAWLFHSGLMGAFVAPITMLGGPILIKAAWYTAAIVGSLSVIAATAPSQKFLNMSGPLAIGLGGVFAASIGSMFFPPTTRLGLSLYSISIYGGILLFSAFMLYDTQRIANRAENSRLYDPINESISIYMNTLNIFIRMASIFAMGGNRKK